MIPLLCLTLLASPVFAPGWAGTDPESTLAFAQRLAAQDDNYRAITEYRRFAYLVPKDPRAVSALETAGWLALEAKQYKEAGNLFAAATRVARDAGHVASGDVPPKILYARAALWDAEGFDVDAAPDFEAVAKAVEATDPKLAADARWRAAWSKFDATLRMGAQNRGSRKISDAIAPFAQIKEPGRSDAIAGITAASVRDKKLRYRSPSAAAILQMLLPGAGFAYVGRPGPAVASFVLNGLFITGIVYSIVKRNYPLGAILVGMELGWYFGGASGAANAALDANEKAREELAQRYRNEWFGTVYPPGIF